jgi:hypothetical protein
MSKKQLRAPTPTPQFKLSDELRKRAQELLAKPLDAITYVEAAKLGEELGQYGKPFYVNNFFMDRSDMLLSDQLTDTVAKYETELEKVQLKMTAVVDLTDKLVDAVGEAVKVTETRNFDLTNPGVENLKMVKEKLTQSLDFVDQLIALAK